MTETAFYRWRKAYGGMSVSEAQRLKKLEKENARLKRLLAERDLALETGTPTGQAAREEEEQTAR